MSKAAELKGVCCGVYVAGYVAICIRRQQAHQAIECIQASCLFSEVTCKESKSKHNAFSVTHVCQGFHSRKTRSITLLSWLKACQSRCVFLDPSHLTHIPIFNHLELGCPERHESKSVSEQFSLLFCCFMLRSQHVVLK
jgi:hypothetical protein